MRGMIDVVKPFVPPVMRRALRSGLTVVSGQMRVMPDFLVIGAAKCGTNSLYQYLIQHPCIASAFRGAIHFFDHNFQLGLHWYRTHFSTSLQKCYVQQVRKQDFFTVNWSPDYIYHPHAPRRIFEILPHAKAVVLLRNPVDRAYSDYQMGARRGRETLSFEEAIAKETERIGREREKILEDEHYYSFNYRFYSYLARGIYVNQLKEWMRFFPKERLLIIRSEDFFADPSAIFQEVLRFLGLPKWEPKEYRVFNRGTYANIDVAMRKRLVEFYEPHNQRLYDYLRINFGWDR